MESLNVFNNLTLKWIFCKTKTFFKKLEYRFLVESTKTDNASFPYKIATSEANIRTNRMTSTKWTHQKEWSFASNYFLKNFCFSLRNSYKEMIWCTNDPNVHIHIFRKRWRLILGGFLSVSILKLYCGLWISHVIITHFVYMNTQK